MDGASKAPGPGAYNIPAKIGHDGPSYSLHGPSSRDISPHRCTYCSCFLFSVVFMVSNFLGTTAIAPGPGAYVIQSTIGQAPAYSLGLRPKTAPSGGTLHPVRCALCSVSRVCDRRQSGSRRVPSAKYVAAAAALFVWGTECRRVCVQAPLVATCPHSHCMAQSRELCRPARVRLCPVL
jgi:hypothetical protein